MGEKSAFNIAALQKNIQETLTKPEAKQSCLLFEYKLLLLYSANFGIYVMPQLDSPDVWHGVVFVRFGIYKDAKFKFKIVFDQFPVRPPKVSFISEVWHPKIHPETGLLDLGAQIEKEWNYGTEHLIFTVVEHVRLIFLDVSYYEITDSYNKAAGQQFVNSPDEYFLRIRESVENSKAQLYNNYEKTSLKFTHFNSKHEKMREKLKEICDDQSLSADEKKKIFLKSLKQNV